MKHSNKKRAIRYRMVMAVVSLCCAALGCGGRLTDEPERVPVSGTVSYGGQPIDEGEIRFVPTKGTEAPVSSAPIKVGAYTANVKGGVPIGTHRVEIRAYRPQAGASTEEVPGMAPGQAPQEQYIPAKYNSASTLELAVDAGGSAMTRDFSLEK